MKLVPEDNIDLVIDLSMGECGLLEAAKRRWKNASYYGADIDESLLSKIHEKAHISIHLVVIALVTV